MRLAVPLVLSVIGLGCSRDLTIPPEPAPPGPGNVYGRVVVSVPGRSEHQPAANATVALLGSSLSTTSNDQGNFRLDGVDQTSGSLLFRYELAGLVRQRLVDLGDIGAGPGRQISLGDVLVVDNASLHGTALRADVAGVTGHGGTVVFVPQGPFTAYTGDDGTYLLENLPEGRISLAFFRTGYTPVTRDDLELRSGEDFPVQLISLTPAPPAQPGSVSGTVRFNPAASAVATTNVTATALGGTSTAGAVMEDGTFTVMALQPGVYDVGFSHDGYTPAVVNNVLVSSGTDTQLGDVLLTQGVAYDAGTRPPAPDGGLSPDGGGGGCGSTAECGVLQWCDPEFGVCRAQCTGPSGCSDGRVCDVPTGTCARPCNPGCPTGQACDIASQTCRAVCDVSTPCASGFRCNAQNQCVHECTVTADCTAPHRMCQAGACVRDLTCTTDLDCTSAELCTGTTCIPRQGPRGTDGGFLCANPCLCRLDESCESGACAPSVAPTRYLTADGGGDGLTMATASSDLFGLGTDGGVLALRAGDVFDLPTELDLGAPVVIAGGFVECGPTRWVRSSDQRSTVTGNNTIFRVVGTGPVPVSGVALQNLTLFDRLVQSCESLIEATYAPGLVVQHVSGSLPIQRTGCQATPPLMGVLECEHSDGVRVDDLVLAGQLPTGSSSFAGAVRLGHSSGTLSNVSTTGIHEASPYVAVWADSPSGPVDIRGGNLGPEEEAGGDDGYGVAVSNCGTFPVSITGVHVAMPLTGGVFTGISVVSCTHATVSDCVIDGSQGVRTTSSAVFGIHVVDSTGAVDCNTVLLPTGVSLSAGTYTGIELEGPRGPSSVTLNSVSHGTSNIAFGIALDNLDSGAMHVEKNTVTLGAAASSQGLHLQTVAGTLGLVVRDNTFWAGTNTVACAGPNDGLAARDASGLFERNRFYSSGSDSPFGATFASPGQIELYDNHLWAGHTWVGANCGSAATGLEIAPGAGVLSLFAIGNTIDGDGDIGLYSVGMTAYDGALLFMSSNIISGGQTPNAFILAPYISNTGTSFVSSQFSDNYFYLPNVGQVLQKTDLVSQVALNPTPGAADARGNILGTAPCFDLTQPVPHYKLASGTPCINAGDAGVRQDGTAISFDIDGNPRTLGPATDIGCSEKQ